MNVIKGQKYFFDKKSKIFSDIKKKILLNKNIILFLDYDGTLVPIKKKPEDAVLTNSTRELINNLSKLRYIYLGIISGRSMDDIMKLVGIKNILYAANHGFEIYSENFKWRHPEYQNIYPYIQKLNDILIRKLNQEFRVKVENKGITLSVHYRNLKGLFVYSLKDIVRKQVDRYKRILKISYGKKVIEIKPRIRWNKGKAILKILREFDISKDDIVIYIGDDKTDEDAFKCLLNKGITVFVGDKRKTNASHFVKDSNDVEKILKRIYQLKKGNK